jgi:ubiquinone/menaquinone biosynthesis C-methylase UbiE
MLAALKPYLLPGISIEEKEHYLQAQINQPGDGLKANAYYFNNTEWAEEYLTYCHRSDEFINRWRAAMGDCTGKTVLDIGCGPGNIFASLKGSPKLLIGVDVAPKSLQLAKQFGYIPLLADATNLPFVTGFADVVTLNASLHHCEDMEAVLKEAARMVKPGGILITDHDPQLSAWDYKGLAKLLWNMRLVWYKLTGHGFHKTNNQQYWGLACELHHKPGDGVTKQMFRSVLEPSGFDVRVFPHNHTVGSGVLNGEKGKAELKYRIGNILSGRNPNADDSALTLMCVAEKRAGLKMAGA